MGRSDYGNARVAGRRVRLLGERGLREVLVRPAAAERPAIELAVEARQVLAFLSGRPQRLVAALLRLEDEPVLEAVLRGLVRRDPPARILAGAPPAPGLSPDLLGELAALPGPERVPDALARWGSPLAAAAAAAVAAAREEPRLLRLGVALQRAVAQGTAAELTGAGEDAPLARAALALRVDHGNAATLLAVEAPAHPGELFVGGGTLDVAGFARLFDLGTEARRPAVARWLSGAVLPGAVDPAALADPGRAQEHLARLRERWLHRQARARPLSIAVPLAYLAARAGEARRLRLVQLGGEHGLPADALLDVVEA